MFSGGIKGNIDPKWVKQRQYWREFDVNRNTKPRN